MLEELIAITESPLGQKATKASVDTAEEDLAELATTKTSPTARASGVER